MKQPQWSVWETSFPPKHEQINHTKLSSSTTDQYAVSNSAVNTNLYDLQQIKQIKTSRKQRRYSSRLDNIFHFIQCFLTGLLLAGLVLAIIIALWLTEDKATTTFPLETQASGGIIISTLTVTTATTSTASTSTSSTTTTTTKSTTSTSTSTTTTSTTTSTTSTSTSTTTTTTTTSTTTTSTTSTSTTTATPTCATWMWNATGVTVAGISGNGGSSANQLNEPWNIYVDQTNDYLYIADSKNNRIQRWLPGATSGTTVAGTGGPGSTPIQLDTPKDVFVDSQGNLYVADTKNQRIQFFPNGSMTGITVSSAWPSIGELWGVQAVAGSIYASDFSKSAVWKNGSAVAGNAGSGGGSNQLNEPQGLAVDTSVTIGTVYAVNSKQHTIVQWAINATAGIVVAGVSGNGGSSSTLLRYPTAVKLDNYTNMFIVDNNNHRIQLFCRYPTINMTGRTIVGTGASGMTPQSFNFPAGIALDASLNLYVSDTSNHRVQKFQRLL